MQAAPPSASPNCPAGQAEQFCGGGGVEGGRGGKIRSDSGHAVTLNTHYINMDCRVTAWP